MSATTAPAVKAKLLEMFTAVADGETEVWYGRTNEEHQQNENVYICGVQVLREWKLLGRPNPHQREENYIVEVDVEVFMPGVDGQLTEQRLWEIVEALDSTLTADPSLNGAFIPFTVGETIGALENIQWVLLERIDQSSQAMADGWFATAKLEIAVKARI